MDNRTKDEVRHEWADRRIYCWQDRLDPRTTNWRFAEAGQKHTVHPRRFGIEGNSYDDVGELNCRQEFMRWLRGTTLNHKAAAKTFGEMLKKHGKLGGALLAYHDVSGPSVGGWIKLIGQDAWDQMTQEERSGTNMLNKLRNKLWSYRDSVVRDTIIAHMLRPSLDDPEKVAYCPSLEYYKAGRRVKTKLGRYLNKFFAAHFTSDEIRDIATWYEAAQKLAELKLATTREEMIRVINFGPSESCMAQAFHSDRDRSDPWWRGPMHPAAAYYTPENDVAIGYLQEGDTVTARAIINLKTKKHSRIYGDRERLRGALEGKYKLASGALLGIRMAKIQDPNDSDRYVMPYIDAGTGGGGGGLDVVDRGDYFVTVCSGDGICTQDCYENGGLINIDGDSIENDDEDMRGCDHCGGADHYDNMRTAGDDYICESCTRAHYTYAYISRHDMDYVRNEAVVEGADGNSYHEDCANNNLVYVGRDELYYEEGDVVHCEVDDKYENAEECVRLTHPHYGDDVWAHKDDVVDVNVMEDGAETTYSAHKAHVERNYLDQTERFNPNGADSSSHPVAVYNEKFMKDAAVYVTVAQLKARTEEFFICHPPGLATPFLCLKSRGDVKLDGAYYYHSDKIWPLLDYLREFGKPGCATLSPAMKAALTSLYRDAILQEAA